MQVWREVRFPTVSNSILQTVRKHAAALQALAARYLLFYASQSNYPHLQISPNVG